MRQTHKNTKALILSETVLALIFNSLSFVFVQTDGVSAGGPLCERCVWTRIGPTAFLMTDDVLSMAEIPRRLGPLDHHMMFLAFF